MCVCVCFTGKCHRVMCIFSFERKKRLVAHTGSFQTKTKTRTPSFPDLYLSKSPKFIFPSSGNGLVGSLTSFTL